MPSPVFVDPTGLLDAVTARLDTDRPSPVVFMNPYEIPWAVFTMDDVKDADRLWFEDHPGSSEYWRMITQPEIEDVRQQGRFATPDYVIRVRQVRPGYRIRTYGVRMISPVDERMRAIIRQSRLQRQERRRKERKRRKRSLMAG
jgi:hypothetical protein